MLLGILQYRESLSVAIKPTSGVKMSFPMKLMLKVGEEHKNKKVIFRLVLCLYAFYADFLLCSFYYFSGTDTVASFLEWFVLYMTAFPEIQEKCFREIEQSLGQDHQPTLMNKDKTPFLEATIQEVQRHCPHLALTIQHFAMADAEIEGYFVPKGTQVKKCLNYLLYKWALTLPICCLGLLAGVLPLWQCLW